MFSDIAVRLQDIPIQTNGHDCDVFLCMVSLLQKMIHPNEPSIANSSSFNLQYARSQALF